MLRHMSVTCYVRLHTSVAMLRHMSVTCYVRLLTSVVMLRHISVTCYVRLLTSVAMLPIRSLGTAGGKWSAQTQAMNTSHFALSFIYRANYVNKILLLLKEVSSARLGESDASIIYSQ